MKTVSTKKKQTNRDKGYVTRREAAHALRRLAADLEALTDGDLIKFSINIWRAPEDEPNAPGMGKRLGRIAELNL